MLFFKRFIFIWSLAWEHLQKMGLPQLQCRQRLFPNTVVKYEWEFSEISPIWLMDRKIFLSNQTSEDGEFAAAAAAQLVHLCQSSATTSLFHPHMLRTFGLVIFYPSTRCPQIVTCHSFINSSTPPIGLSLCLYLTAPSVFSYLPLSDLSGSPG